MFGRLSFSLGSEMDSIYSTCIYSAIWFKNQYMIHGSEHAVVLETGGCKSCFCGGEGQGVTLVAPPAKSTTARGKLCGEFVKRAK